MSRTTSCSHIQPVGYLGRSSSGGRLLGVMLALPVTCALLGASAFAAPPGQAAPARPLMAISDLSVTEKGDATLIQLRAAARPMFSVFKLERPARLTVDVANGELRGVPGLLDVETWAVSQVATARFHTAASTIARIMINFRRPCHYTVRTEGNNLLITVLPDQPRPPTDPARLSRELQDARREVDQARQQTQVGQQALEQARSTASQLQAAAEAARRLAEERLQAVKAARSAAERERLQAAAAQSLAEQRQKESAAARAQLEQERKQAELARTQALSARAEAERLKSEALVLRKEAEQHKQVASSQTRALQQTVAALQKHDADLKAAQTEASRSKLALARAQGDLAARAGLVEKLRSEAERARQLAKQDAAGRRADMVAARDRLQQIESQLTDAVNAMKQAQAARARSESLVSEAEERRQSAEGARQKAEVAWGSARRAQQEAEQARQAAERARQSAEASRLLAEQQLQKEEARRREAERARLEAEARATQLARAKEEVQTRKTRLDQLAGKVRDLEQELQRAQARETQQREQLSRAQTEVDQSRQAAREAQQALKELSSQTVAERQKGERLLREIGKVKGELEQQKSRAAVAIAEVEKLGASVREARARLARQTDQTGRSAAQAELQRVEQRLQKAEGARLAAERARSQLVLDIQQREQQQKVAAAAVQSAERQLAQARGLARSTEQQLGQADRRLAESRQALAGTVAQRQAEEGRRQRAEQARLGEEKRFTEAKAKREGAEQARASAERKLAEVKTALAEARQARLLEEKALAQLKREQQQQASLEVQRVLKQRQRNPRAPAQWASKEKDSNRAKAAPALVRDIRYVDGDKTAQIQILLEGNPAHRLGREGRSPVLSLEGIVMPRLLQRTLDVSEFSGPISQITSFVPEAGAAAMIKVSLREPGTPSRLRQEGDRLIWEFQKPVLARVGPATAGPEAAPRADDAVSFASPQVAGVRVRGGQQRRYTGRRIDLDFKDADIHNILRLLSEVGNVNIVTADNVSGRVTIRMRNVPWDQALDVILRAKGLGQVREGNLLRVAPATDLEKERESEIARQKQMALLKPLETRLIPLSYARAQGMLDKVRYSLSPRGALTFDERTNMVIARDISGNLDLMERMIRNLDTQTPQVLIEARIVEARTNYAKELGIQWGGFFAASPATGNATGLVFPSTIGFGGGATDTQAPIAGLIPTPANPAFAVNLPATTGTGRGGAVGLTLGSVSGNVNINLRLSAAESTGDIRIVSAPKITTLDNVEAKIEQGVTIPFSQVSAAGVQTTFMDAKLNLTVRPHVTADGSVIMSVEVTRNEPDFANTGPRGEPTILKKEAKTEMLVKDGDTAVIGGIYTTRTGQRFSKVPWFADIPILGYLFRSRSETSDREEVLVFITPRIINRAQSIGGGR